MSDDWPRFHLLCQFLAGRHWPVDAPQVEAAQLARLRSLAREHDVIASLAYCCQHSRERIPGIRKDLEVQLNNELLQNTTTNLQYILQSVKLVKALNAVGILPMLLKGTALLMTINRDKPGFRSQVDIDLIVPEEQLAATWQCLADEGYYFIDRTLSIHDSERRSSSFTEAIRQSRDHHHLPCLVHDKFGGTVELHKHHLPGRFQKGNPVASLFSESREIREGDGRFLIPSAEHQIIQIILGNYIHDGWRARQSLPLKQVLDYLEIKSTTQRSGYLIDRQLIEERCGNSYQTFCGLVDTLTGNPRKNPAIQSPRIAFRAGMIHLRYTSRLAKTLFNTYARIYHLLTSLVSNPAKLPGYLSRRQVISINN